MYTHSSQRALDSEVAVIIIQCWPVLSRNSLKCGVRDVSFKRTRAASDLGGLMELTLNLQLRAVYGTSHRCSCYWNTAISPLFFDRPLANLKVMEESCSALRKAERFNAV